MLLNTDTKAALASGYVCHNDLVGEDTFFY